MNRELEAKLCEAVRGCIPQTVGATLHPGTFKVNDTIRQIDVSVSVSTMNYKRDCLIAAIDGCLIEESETKHVYNGRFGGKPCVVQFLLREKA